MLNKKLVGLTILLACLMAISAVSAEENATDEVIALEGDDAVELDASQGDFISDGNYGNFTELESMIENAENGSTITLEKDYVHLDGEYIRSETRAGYYGIEITKPLTIDGKGHTIDARGNGGIFKLYGSNIYLKNITFANGKTHDGGAIYLLEGSWNLIESCNFINCSANTYGGAIDNVYATEVEILSCNFTNCSSSYGAILNRGMHLSLISCNFNECHGYYGGAFFNWGVDSFVVSSNFTDCYSTENGGAITSDVEYLEVDYCNFNGCHSHNGGAIYGSDSGNYFIIYSSNFNDCSASNGGAIYVKHLGSTSLIQLCNFTNCSNQAIFFSGYYYNNKFSYEVALCNFLNCSSTGQGGAVYSFCPNVYFEECTFRNCSAENGFGAIFTTSENNAAINTTFYDYPSKDSAVNNNTELVNCTFKKYGQEDEPVVVVDNSKISAANVKVTYNSGSYFTITVWGIDGKLADKAQVDVKINGKAFAILKTDSNGIAKFKVTQLPGSYKVLATAFGKQVQKTLTVNHAVTLKSVTVKKSAKKLVLQATLAKVNGKYLKNKQIIFKFNGKTYKAKTNSKGVAKYTLKSSVLKKLKVGKKVIYQATYLKDTVKKTAKVKK